MSKARVRGVVVEPVAGGRPSVSNGLKACAVAVRAAGHSNSRSRSTRWIPRLARWFGGRSSPRRWRWRSGWPGSPAGWYMLLLRRARAGCLCAGRSERLGAIAHLAEPVETSALRGRKRRAKTDRADARWLRELLVQGRLPEAWAPPEHVRQWRSRARLRNTLVAERTSWTQRIRATLYHHGVAGAPDELRTLAGRQFLAGLELPVDARERITVALEIIDLLDAQLGELEREPTRARAPPGRLPGADGPVRDGRDLRTGHAVRARGHHKIARLPPGCPDGRNRYRRAPLRPPRPTGQAHPTRLRPLRWALFEAAQSASRVGSPDYHDYLNCPGFDGDR
jgi:Transposase